MPRDDSLTPRDLVEKLDGVRGHFGFKFSSDGSFGKLILVARRLA
jgi:hypothetical protein